MGWYTQFWKRYFDFSGRSRRLEFWTASIVNSAAFIMLAMIEGHIYKLPIIALVFLLAAIIPSVAINIRRFHDIGRSGYWILLTFVPFVGPVVVLVMQLLDSQPGTNEYGPNPKDAAYL